MARPLVESSKLGYPLDAGTLRGNIDTMVLDTNKEMIWVMEGPQTI